MRKHNFIRNITKPWLLLPAGIVIILLVNACRKVDYTKPNEEVKINQLEERFFTSNL